MPVVKSKGLQAVTGSLAKRGPGGDGGGGKRRVILSAISGQLYKSPQFGYIIPVNQLLSTRFDQSLFLLIADS
jgi:hypothetical protein